MIRVQATRERAEGGLPCKHMRQAQLRHGDPDFGLVVGVAVGDSSDNTLI